MKRLMPSLFLGSLLWANVCHGQTNLSAHEAVSYALSHRPELRGADVRFRECKIAEVDLLRVRLQAEQIQAASANARLDSEKALLTLAEEMNAAPDSSWALSEDFEALEEPKPIPAGASPISLRTEERLA